MTIRRRPTPLFRDVGVVDPLRCVAKGLFVSDYDVRGKECRLPARILT